MTILFLLIVVFSLFFPIASVSAHTADQYMHEIEVYFLSNSIDLEWKLMPGPLLASALWAEVDLNGDETIDPSEQLAFCSDLLDEFSSRSNAEQLPKAVLRDCRWPQEKEALLLGDEWITLTARIAEFSAGDETLTFQLKHDFYREFSVSIYHLHAEAGWQFEGMTQSLNTLDGKLVYAPGQDTPKAAVWNSEEPDLSAFSGQGSSLSPFGQGLREELNRLLTQAQNRRGGAFIFSILFLPFALGMLHAFTPGHGKSVVAAYMVGARGNWRQGIFLGLIVALTHTSIVILSGLVVLFGASFFVVENIYPFFETLSALAILILGIILLIQRLRFLRKSSQDETPPAEVIDQGPGKQRILIRQPITEGGPPHPSIGPKYIPRHKADLSRLEWRTLLALGTSGGLVPCPDAIAIFLIAASLNLLQTGVVMITSFSVGIALVLMLLGLLIAVGKSNLEKVRGMDAMIAYAPMASALLVLAVGLFLMFNVTQKYTPQFQKAAAALTSAAFDPYTTRIAYLDYDENELSHIFALDPASQEITKLTRGNKLISEFVLSPNNHELFYTNRDVLNKTAQLWGINIKNNQEALLVSLPGATIHNLHLSADDVWLLFDRYDTTPNDSFIISNSIWGYNIQEGKLHPLLNSAGLISFSPTFSPDMQWFSYFSPINNQYHLYNLQDGSELAVDSRMGLPLEWSPQEPQMFLFQNSLRSDGSILQHTFLHNLQDGTTLDVSEITGLNIQHAFWSGAEDQIIAVVKDLGEHAGSQFYAIQADTFSKRMITTHKPAFPMAYNHLVGGRYLLFEQSGILNYPDHDGLWVADLEKGILTQLHQSGFQPKWLDWKIK